MNTTVIIPIHKYNDNIEEYLLRALKSIETQENIEIPEVIIVYTSEIESEFINNFVPKLSMRGGSILPKYIKNDTKSDYQSQINFAVKQVTTDYFSVLEFDDEYGTSFFKNAQKYIEAYPNIDIFLTMMIEVNEKNEGIKLTNETVWSQQFVGENGEIGYLNSNALKQYSDFKISGGIIKTSEFNNLGGYKSNIKLTFMYEFLLRALNNGTKIFSIPKIGYKHLATREDSLFNEYLKTMAVEERKFWFETAIKESNFMNDRLIDLSKIQKIVVQ